MKEQNEDLTDAASLRQQAEERLRKQQSKTASVSSEVDMLKLIHELEVHQIELEMQNEELVIAKEKAEFAEGKYTVLYDFASASYLSLTKDGKITELNFAAAQMLGKKRLHLIKNKFDLFLSVKTRPVFNLFLEKVFTRNVNQSCEVTIVPHDNSAVAEQVLPIDVTINAIVSQNDEICLLTLIDITKRKQVEEEASRMVTVVRDSNDAITIQNTEGRITAWNRGAERMYGYSEAEALQMSIERLTANGKVEEQKDFTRRLLVGETITSLETQRVTKDGCVLDVWMTVTKLVDDAGESIGIASTERDITERKRTEESLRKLNEELEQRVIERTKELVALNKELETFSYSVSHDLRVPLRHINGYVNLLNENFHADLPEKATYYLNTITNATSQMGKLIDDLLQLSRTGRQKVRKAKIEMNALVEEVVESIKQDTEKREITWKVQKLPQVLGDDSLLKMVWINLLDNAVKYTKNINNTEISIGFKEEEKNLIFYISDNGVGFNMKYAHKLFGVFQRLHSEAEFEGTGIGLANVQRIIRKHNGQVWAEAELGKGATFFFSLPKTRKDI